MYERYFIYTVSLFKLGSQTLVCNLATYSRLGLKIIIFIIFIFFYNRINFFLGLVIS